MYRDCPRISTGMATAHTGHLDPFVDQRANIYRLAPGVTPWLVVTDQTGLTGCKMITDLALDEHSNLCVR